MKVFCRFWSNDREPYRDVSLEDLEKNQPRWIVDAVAPGSFNSTDRETHGIQTFPEFEEILKCDHEPIDKIDGVRIYERNPLAHVH